MLVHRRVTISGMLPVPIYTLGRQRETKKQRGKPGNSGKNSNGTLPSRNFPEKSNTFWGITFFPFLPKRPTFSIPLARITSARLQVERKRKIYWCFINGTTQSRSCFRCEKKYQYHLTEIFRRNFRTNGKRSKWSKVPCLRKQRKGRCLNPGPPIRNWHEVLTT